MKLLNAIKGLFRIDLYVFRNGRMYYKSKFERTFERITQIVFVVGLIGLLSVLIRFIF